MYITNVWNKPSLRDNRQFKEQKKSIPTLKKTTFTTP